MSSKRKFSQEPKEVNRKSIFFESENLLFIRLDREQAFAHVIGILEQLSSGDPNGKRHEGFLDFQFRVGDSISDRRVEFSIAVVP